MTINRIAESLGKVVDSENREKTQPKMAMPPFISMASETNTAEKCSNQQNYGDYRRNQIQTRWTEQQQNQAVGKPATKQTAELKPMYDGVKTTVELNKKFLEMVQAVDPQPTGIKPKKNQSGGVEASESAAKLHAQSMSKHDLKAKFERLGEKYLMPPSFDCRNCQP